MSQDQFKLLGHDNPLGRYPAPVVPIGELNKELVAVYASADGPKILRLGKEQLFVRHESVVAAKLKSFNYHHHRLFGLGEQHVDYYPIADESKYFYNLLRDPDFSSDNRFLRLSLAKATSNTDALVDELYGCVANVRYLANEDFVDSWYKREREAILNTIDAKYHFRFPQFWKVLLHIQQARKPSLTRPPEGFFQQSTSDASEVRGGMAAGAAMAAALMVVALFNKRVDAEDAYQSLIKRQYRNSDINLLMLEKTRQNLFPDLQQELLVPEHHIAEGSLATLLVNGEFVGLGNETLVCSGPFATRLSGARVNPQVENLPSAHRLIGDLFKGLVASGLTEGQAKAYDEGIKHGGILMGVSSVADADAWYFENEWAAPR